MVVDDTTGILAVVYYDTIKDPNRLKTDIWMQTSKDGGVTWSHAGLTTTAETDELGPVPKIISKNMETISG